jgi:deoxyribonuclease V
MKACLDVNYRETLAFAAAATFRDWFDAHAVYERVVEVPTVQPYETGQFFRRELPCLLAVLRMLPPVKTVIIDGYVWLDGMSKPGLGAYLYEALRGRVKVIGVAKTRFQGADRACEVIRGASRRPLFVTAAGMRVDLAAEHVRSMYGNYRIPSLLARVDYLCRHEGAVFYPPRDNRAGQT